MKKFWFVWNPAGRAPSYKHESKTSARKEAERLAELNPGQSFARAYLGYRDRDKRKLPRKRRGA